MLLNIEDWKDFFRDLKQELLNPNSIFKGKERLEFFWAGIQDLVFNGGLTCNFHGKFLCKKCYSKSFVKKEKKRISKISFYSDIGGTSYE